MSSAKRLNFNSSSSEDEHYQSFNIGVISPQDEYDNSKEEFSNAVIPRRLCFTSTPGDISPAKADGIPFGMVNACNNNNKHMSSPPYKRVRALNLRDCATTPKTILERSSIILQPQFVFTPVPKQRFRQVIDNPISVATSFQSMESLDKPTANLNPFTPSGMLAASKKRSRSRQKSLMSETSPDEPRMVLNDSDCSEGEFDQPTKKHALHDNNITRYHQEFHEMGLVGRGDFGSVHKCLNRLDGCIYAVKKSLKPVAGSVNEKVALNEVYAHAVLGKHEHVVRYYSAWAEDDHMVIQNEYCNGGSLGDMLEENRRSGKLLSEQELRQLLLQVSEGLRYIHSMQLVHLDIKPGNIFISRESRLSNLSPGRDEVEEEDQPTEQITYKIGDLGHVTSTNNPQVEEGDCRYLPLEILREDYDHLAKADIFALGLTVYETGGGAPMPKNGSEWQEIRSGKLPDLPHYSKDLNDLIKRMVSPDLEQRPSAAWLVQHSVLCPASRKSTEQLQRELNVERQKNEILSKRLQHAERCFQALPPNVLVKLGEAPTTEGRRKGSRLVGKKLSRSHSTTIF